MNFLDTIKRTVNKYKLIDKGNKIVVGVSGGPDSVALLIILNSLKKDLDLDLYVAHLDHMLRNDSGKDRVFVEKLCIKMGIPVTIGKANCAELKKSGSLEENARNARLAFLFKVAAYVRADKIALGHNLDDQAETVLMRLLRGAGLYGLSGILPKRDIQGFCIIRPLIETKRADIEKFLKKNKAKWRIDKTNLLDVYFRNKIRHKLLPLLEKEYNSNIKEVLRNTAENVGYDYEYLDQAARRISKKMGSVIRIDKFAKLHPSLQRMILRLNIARVKGDTRRITSKHIKELESLLLSRPVNSIVDLPKGVSVKKKKNTLSFYRR